MAKKMRGEDNLHDLLLLKMHSLLDVETELVKALPKMVKAASDEQLRAAFEMHLGETENHVRRLEKCLLAFGEKVKKEKVEAIRGLVMDSALVIKNIKNDAARDAFLIASGQYVEHYEMAGYGAAVEWAALMGHSDAEALLKETLAEEKATDEKLNQLAKGGINQRANVKEGQLDNILEPNVLI